MHTALSQRRWITAARWLVAAGGVVCALALALLPVSVESVLFTGPLLFLIGVAMIVAGNLTRYLLAALLGTAHCTICILFFALVQIRNWGPTSARERFVAMGVLYAIAVIPVSMLAWLRPPRPPAGELKCPQCGYLLYGLQEPRCPECGTAFDPAMIGGPPPLPASGIGLARAKRPMD